MQNTVVPSQARAHRYYRGLDNQNGVLGCITACFDWVYGDTIHSYSDLYMGSCQHYGPFLGT